ncbi:MAG: hypothetical protein D6734_04420, partial [Candidatus Schekmanbacteria bacterium]
MDYIPKETLKKRFYSLPDRLQDVILSEDTAGVIRKAANFADVEEQAGTIAILTGRVLMGFLHPDEFKDALKEELNIDERTALQVSEMIRSQVFDLVEAELRKLYPPKIKTPTVTSKGFLNVDKKEEKKEDKDDAFKMRFMKTELDKEADLTKSKKDDEIEKGEIERKDIEDKNQVINHMNN